MCLQRRPASSRVEHSAPAQEPCTGARRVDGMITINSEVTISALRLAVLPPGNTSDLHSDGVIRR